MGNGEGGNAAETQGRPKGPTRLALGQSGILTGQVLRSLVSVLVSEVVGTSCVRLPSGIQFHLVCSSPGDSVSGIFPLQYCTNVIVLIMTDDSPSRHAQ